MIMIFTAFIGVVAVATDSDAASSTADYSVTGADSLATGKTGEYKLVFTEGTPYDTLEVNYTAALEKDGKAVTSGVSPSSGSLTNGKEVTLKVSSQKEAGSYVLKVTIKEKVKFQGETETTEFTYTVTKKISIIEPITLSVTLENKGQTDLYKASVVFYLDGKLIEGSETEVTVNAGEKTTVSYDYVPYNLSAGSHTYYIEATNGAVIDGIGPDHKATLHFNEPGYDYLNYVGLLLVVLMVIALVWVLRKPVKNRGKPKARRD